MDLQLPTTDLNRYKSASQRARVSTESWGGANLYCVCCDSPRLNASPHNTPAVDYVCSVCNSPFQLKSRSRPFGRRIVDSAYAEMRQSILEDRTPNLFLLHYESLDWTVRNVVLVPHFAFTLSAVERRRALGPSARRAGWVGCNIVLEKIPMDARIPVVQDGAPLSPGRVRHAYARLRPLEDLDVERRGWTLDVLQVVTSLNKNEFSLGDVYALETTLARLHPKNRHVRDKIRQQLQVLRDIGVLEFLGVGEYRLR